VSVARRRGPKPGLSPDQIVDVAYGMLAEGGVEEFSMRKLAAALGVSGMAIYTYFPNREALLRRLYDECVGHCPLAPPSAGTWRARLTAHQVDIVQILARFPGLNAYKKGAGSSGPNGVRNRDAILQMLLDAGFDPERSAEIYGATQLLTRGCLASAARRGVIVVPPTPDGDDALQQALEAYRRRDPYQRHLVALDMLLAPLEDELALDQAGMRS
jgi:AcrR family transcriptional regulator